MSKILICVAGMPCAEPTVRFGGLVARLRESHITFLTVVEKGADPTTALDNLRKAQAMLPQQLSQIGIRQGQAALEIIRQSALEPYDMIVMGERNGSRSDLFLSSVVPQVIQRVSIPVIVVKKERHGLERILICTGGREAADPVIRTGARLAQLARARVTLLHVVSPLPSMYTGLATMEEELTELLQTDTPVARHLRQGAAILDEHGLSAELKLRHGVAAHEILHEGQQGDYDLIVVGHWPRPNLLRGLFSHDIAREVVDNASRPVLIVHSPGESDV